MYIAIPGFSNHRAYASANDSETRFIKREIEVGPTVSTVVALVYLGLWLAGVGLCVFHCMGRSSRSRLGTIFVWKGWRRTRKRPEFKTDKSGPTSQRNSRSGGGSGSGSSGNAQGYTDADLWGGGFERMQPKPWKGKNIFSGTREDHIGAGPSEQRVQLSRIDEESMSNRLSNGGSRAISRDGTIHAKPKRSMNATGLSVEDTEINSPSSHFPDLRSSPSSRNLTPQTYGLPIHQLASAATSSASLRLDSPLTEESGISRQLVTPSLDAFPLPPPPMVDVRRDPSPRSNNTSQSANSTGANTSILRAPSYHTNDPPLSRNSHPGTDPSVSTLPLYSSRRVSSQTGASTLSTVTMSDVSVGTGASQPVVATVQQAQRVPLLGSGQVIAVSDLNHFEVGRAV